MVVSVLAVRGNVGVRIWWCPRITGGDYTQGVVVMVVLVVVDIVVVVDVGIR